MTAYMNSLTCNDVHVVYITCSFVRRPNSRDCFVGTIVDHCRIEHRAKNKRMMVLTG